ncbi:CopG family ribbon-helix-helix protein [Sphingopyxis sp. NJF-3]
MGKQTVISARLDAETVALVDDIVASQGRSRAWFVAQAVREHAQREAEFLAFVQEGVDAIASGDWISQDEMKQWIAKRRAELKAKPASS